MSDYIERDFRKFDRVEVLAECEEVEKAIKQCFPEYDPEKWSIFDWMRHVSYNHEEMIKEEAEKLDEAFSFELKQEREFSQEAENSLSARNKEIRQWQERVKDLGNTNDRLVGMLTSKAIKAVCVGAVLLVALLLCAGRL